MARSQDWLKLDLLSIGESSSCKSFYGVRTSGEFEAINLALRVFFS